MRRRSLRIVWAGMAGLYMTTTDGIWFCGDLHGEFDPLLWRVQRHRPQAIILLGDIEAPKPLHLVLASILKFTEVWWIPGNHDIDNERFYDNLFGSLLTDHNLHGRVVEIGSLRVGGLGGVFKKKCWEPAYYPNYDSPEEYLRRCGRGNHWRGGLPLKQRATIFPSDYHTLWRQKADILVLHEAPSCHPHGHLVLTDLTQEMGVNSVFHGHHHERREYEGTLDSLGFKAFGVGLRRIVDHHGAEIYHGET